MSDDRTASRRRIAAEEAFEAVGADNIMFAIDYPYQLTEAAVEFLNDAPISAVDKHEIYYGNAERVFGIASREDAVNP